MKKAVVSIALVVGMLTCAQAQVAGSTEENGYGLPSQITLPEPYATESVRRETQVVGWPDQTTPKAPDGLTVRKFASELRHPRWIYVLPNDDVLVAESNDYAEDEEKRAKQIKSGHSANRITLFRDNDGDGIADERHLFLDDLFQPFGMALADGHLYVANSKSIVRFPYSEGANSIESEGEKIADLPAGGYNHHWTRNLMLDKTGEKLLVTVGSSSNVGEHGMEKEKRRANILVMDLDGDNEEVYAWGIRNPNGLDYNPVTGELWTAVNERDKLGDNLVPDYITGVKRGGFYGWPYKYFGDHTDPRWKGKIPEDLPQVIVPDLATGSHTATLDIHFYRGNELGEGYQNGAFVAQHGSWNRAKYIGYKILFVPFENGKPTGEFRDFLTGFMKDTERDQAYGRPTAVAEESDGSLLVVDDDGNTIWSVQPSER